MFAIASVPPPLFNQQSVEITSTVLIAYLLLYTASNKPPICYPEPFWKHVVSMYASLSVSSSGEVRSALQGRAPEKAIKRGDGSTMVLIGSGSET